MSKQTKRMYPAEREKESKAASEAAIQLRTYTGIPQLNISIMGSFDDDVISDLQNAVDLVLKHHGK